MTDVLVSTEDLTVLGGPSSITVDVDFGPQGDRGSQIFVGNGQPNLSTTTLPATPKVYDLYINLLTSDEEYLFIYQYINVPGGNTWTKLFKLLPNTYNVNRTVTFVDGQKTINIPLSKIIPSSMLSNVTSDVFSIQYSISGTSNPVSSVMSIGSIFTESQSGDLTLPISFTAVDFDGTSWTNLATEVTIHLHIALDNKFVTNGVV